MDGRGPVIRNTQVLVIILVSYFMILLDVTGRPNIRYELSFSATELSWVQKAYKFTFGGLFLPCLRVSDFRRRAFVRHRAQYCQFAVSP